MKFQRTLIFTIFLILLNGNTFLWAEGFMQQPQIERPFKEGFKDNYSGRKYNYEGKAKVHPTKSKQGNASKYSQKRRYVNEDNDPDNYSLDFSVFNWVFLIILIIAVPFLAYTLLNEGNSRLFWLRKNEMLQSHQITAENITQTDIKALITNAEKTNDYRLAIRYYYLLVLKQLNLKNFIKYEDDKTNAEYMKAIASQKFSKNFAYTSYIYDYTWYGEFVLNSDEYQSAKDSFVQLIKEINS